MLPVAFEVTDTGIPEGVEAWLSHVDWGCLFLGQTLAKGPGLWMAATEAEADALDAPLGLAGCMPAECVWELASTLSVGFLCLSATRSERFWLPKVVGPVVKGENGALPRTLRYPNC